MAIAKVVGIGASNGAVREFGSGVRKYGVPPVEKNSRVTLRRYWVVACAMAS